jgi:hypothetical protein
MVLEEAVERAAYKGTGEVSSHGVKPSSDRCDRRERALSGKEMGMQRQIA